MMVTLEPVTGAVCEHAEGPTFSPRWRGPRWVDMLAGDVCELGPDKTVHRRHVDDVTALIRPRRGAGFVVVGEHWVWLSDGDDLQSPLRPVLRLLDNPSIRMNEGGCDPAGNLYAGSMAYDKRPRAATLVKVNSTLDVSIVLSGITISNGIGWSPDGTSAYYVDTATSQVDVFDWSAGSGLENRRPFVRLRSPDGLTVDADGGIWVASIGGSAVHRFDPSGRLTQTLTLPVRLVTALTFTGTDLATLLITTSRKGLGSGAEPLAGALFACRPGPVGLPVHEFAG